MKKLIYLIVIVALSYACKNADDQNDAIGEFDGSDDIHVEADLEYIDDMAEYVLAFARPNGRVQRSFPCGTLTVDSTLTQITIDFGDGCQGQINDRWKSGKMVILIQGNRHEQGSTRTISFDNFYLDSIKIDGVFKQTLTAISDTTRQMTISLTDGQLTYPDGSISTRESSHTRTWINIHAWINEVVTLTGNAHGTSRDGIAYQTEISEEIVYKVECRATDVFIPVSGVKVITTEKRTTELDFGAGECDNTVSVTINGKTTEKEINIRNKRN